MTSTPIDTQAQKAAIATDATWDNDTHFGLENQINQDAGKSLGATLKDVVNASKESGVAGSTGIATATPSTSSTLSSSTTAAGTSSGDIPTGLDAIKAGGPQSKSRTIAYSEH